MLNKKYFDSLILLHFYLLFLESCKTNNSHKTYKAILKNYLGSIYTYPKLDFLVHLELKLDIFKPGEDRSEVI